LEPERLDEPRRRAGRLVLDEALVGDLAAAGRVERRLEELRLEEAVPEVGERRDRGQHLRLLVAGEPRLRLSGDADLGRRRAPPGALALLRHEPRELLLVHAEAALACELLRQLDREAVRVVELERVLAGDLGAPPDLLEHA